MSKTLRVTRRRRALVGMLVRMPSVLGRHFRQDSRSTLFSAALAVIVTHVGALVILAKLSLMVVANLAAQPHVASGTGPLVLVLNETRWQQRYLEQSPLDRCTFAQDLQGILDHQPKTIAVDFDLSPSLHADAACQTTLDALLDRHAARLVLLAPFKVSAARLRAVKQDWMRARCRAGVAFGDGGVQESLGMVLDAAPGNDRLAEMVHDRSRGTICQSLATTAGADKWLSRECSVTGAGSAAHGALPQSAAAQSDRGCARDEADEAVAINFAVFARQASRLPVDEPGLATLGNWPQRVVFFGGEYGGDKDDMFRTPIGMLPGIAVHAARFVSLDKPVEELRPFVGFATDILTAFLFSIGIAYFWGLYARCRMAPGAARRQLASVVVMGFLVYYSALVWLFFALGTDLFSAGILIVPLVIAVSMLIDGFITGPIAAILEVVGQKVPNPTAPGHFPALLVVLAMLAAATGLLHIAPLSLAGIGAVLTAVVADRLCCVYFSRGHRHDRREPRPRTSPAGWCVILLAATIATGVTTTRLSLQLTHTGTMPFFVLLTGVSTALLYDLLAIGHVPARLRMHALSSPARQLATPVSGSGDARAPRQRIARVAAWFGVASIAAPRRGHGVRDIPEWIGGVIFCIRKLIFWSVILWALACLFHVT